MSDRRLTLSQWFRIHIVRVCYQCRCGAVVSRDYRAEHEDWHATIRQFLQPPTQAEMHAAWKSDRGGR